MVSTGSPPASGAYLPRDCQAALGARVCCRLAVVEVGVVGWRGVLRKSDTHFGEMASDASANLGLEVLFYGTLARERSSGCRPTRLFS